MSKLTKYRNLDFFHEIDTEEKAYWLGFICADGNIHKKQNLLQIRLKYDDVEHLKKLGNIFGRKVYKKGVTVSKKGNLCSFTLLGICNKSVKDDLMDKEVYPGKTIDDNIGAWKYVPDNLLNHFVRGYFDGDGCITSSKAKSGKTNYCLSIAGGNNFLKELKKIIMDKIGASDTKDWKTETYKVLRWAGREQINLIAQWMYENATVYLERKKEKFDQFYKDVHSRGSSKFRGVVWHKNNSKWLASISHEKRRINLGYYEDEKEAAMAYDGAVAKYNKPVYKLNFRKIG